MLNTYWKRMSSLLIAALLALAGCSGGKGDPGPAGVNTGAITGRFIVTGGAPVTSATVTTDPLGETLTTTTAADGTFTIADVPIGTYSITVSGTRVTQATFSSIVVVAQVTTDIGTKTLIYTPIDINFGTVPNPAGFGQAIALSSTVSGATGTVTYAWTQVSGPTAAAFSSTSVATPTFTTGTVAAINTGGKVKAQRLPERPGLINFTAQQQADATYKLRLTVSDGSYSQSKDLSILPAGWVQGSTNVGRGTMVIGNDASTLPDGTPATYSWVLAGPGSAQLHGATTRNPWFIPDAVGDWTLTNGTTSIAVKVDNYYGVTRTCGACHGATTAAKVTGIWDEYEMSAHGNFYWNDSTHAPKGIFAAGIDGEASDHYGASCPRCHTTGNDSTATNNGFDEQGFTFPAVLQSGNFAALTDIQKRLGTISCESCHGPVAGHTNATNKPMAFFNSEPCGYCHDSGSHHDRYPLWAQSGHANLELAMEEGASASCAKCHSAQGFVLWATPDATTGRVAFDPAFTPTVTWSANDVEPQTCIACHDPHTTRLRIDESAPVVTTSGFTVAGAGAGQLCVTCHTSRRGLHNDGITNTSYSLPHAGKQSDLFFGQNLYFVDVNEINSGATMSTHALVLEGACLGCHMDAALAYEGLNAAPSATNHSFKVSANVCGKCHAGASFEAVETRTVAQVNALKTSIAAAGKRMLPSAGYKLTGIAATIGTTAFTGKATFSTKPDVVTVGLPTGHGTGFTFHWNAPVSVTFTLADNPTIPGGADATVTLGDATLGATVGAAVSATGITDLSNAAVISASSDLFNAWWNMSLAGEDGSFGGHNPPMVQQVLNISKTRADAIPTAP